jgi:hypothetical protein
MLLLCFPLGFTRSLSPKRRSTQLEGAGAYSFEERSPVVGKARRWRKGYIDEVVKMTYEWKY